MTVGTPPGGEASSSTGSPGGGSPTGRSLTIGMLAEAAGVSVKTVRYYSDQGLLPGTGRSAGGHRRYGDADLARLRELRGLRALGLSLPTAAEVARGELPLERALAAERTELARRMAELHWREAALSALAEAPDQLLLLGSALQGPPGLDAFAAFWRRVLPLRISSPVRAGIVEAVLPELPGEPTPAQALAYARLHALASDRALAAEARSRQPVCDGLDGVYLTAGEAYDLVLPELRRGGEPGPEAVELYVSGFARAAGRRDTAGFRRELAVSQPTHPVVARYWALVAQLHGGPTLGDAHDWITTELGAAASAA